ncbi:flagellin [Thalassobacillus sp. CUG 92003]|uniref:flagellin N-terminal helical domain-containing protein n=1 Tax=Thalassobacillus sp. CUG 92003 TaxID=2736641 RepID=UPI0015E74978|nr:flagellin [Thalassobacillus sp. CUG 92003]
MKINHNIAALNTHRQLQGNNNATQNSLEKLSSGLRINKAGDDAAGLAISEKMRGQIRGLEQAQRNAQDGISLVQTAEGAMNESHSIMQRMRELAVQSSNDTNTDADRAELQKEVDQLSQELGRISEDTEFNSKTLLDGNFSGSFQIGANENQSIDISIDEMSADALDVVRGASSAEGVSEGTADDFRTGGAISTDGSFDVTIDGTSSTVTVDDSVATAQDLTDAINSSISNGTASLNDDGGIKITSDSTGSTSGVQVNGFTEGQDGSSNDVTDLEGYFGGGITASGTDRDTSKGIDISSQGAADSAISAIDGAIEKVSSERSKLGAIQNRLDHTINNLGTSSENLTAAESRIRDTDMAAEMMDFTKNNILSQAAQSMLAQANQQPQGVLQLLQ